VILLRGSNIFTNYVLLESLSGSTEQMRGIRSMGFNNIDYENPHKP